MTLGSSSIFIPDHFSGSILEYLNRSSYDELVSINFEDGTYHFIYNIEEKYNIPATSGSFEELLRYFLENQIFYADRSGYSSFMDPDTLPGRLAEADPAGVLAMQYRVRNPKGGWRWVDQIVLSGEENGVREGTCLCYIYDIQNIKDRESGLTRVGSDRTVRLDTLTGLMRETDFFAAADRMISGKDMRWMMLVIDLERFKLFNDWYGRDAGDLVLSRIGSRLNTYANQSGGLASYLGNDDFCLLIPEGSLDVHEVFERIHEVIMRYGVSVGFLPAVGISVSGEEASTLAMFDQASIACQHSKKDFKNRICHFTPGMYERTAEDYRILSDFQDALKNGDITFYLQPQVRASSGKIVGAEALARWCRPDGSLMKPDAFVPVLEKYGFISDLDKYIWKAVFRWLYDCQQRDLPTVSVSVNVSPVDIFTFNVPDYFQQLVSEFPVRPGTVQIELTESAYAEDSGRIRKAVDTLRAQGFQLFMDDFGSGFSSLNMLRELHIDVIKLDAQFLHVRQEEMRRGISILESIVHMTKTLSTPIIAEGVETEAQLRFLQELGCSYVQGYLFYQPMPAQEFEEFLKDPSGIDLSGFTFKANQQMRVREFLDENIFSDSMLNNILGPVVFYNWDGENIDIVRFNEQFYEMVGIGLESFDERRKRIQRFLHPGDVSKMEDMFRDAQVHMGLGSRGVIRTFNPNGALKWLSLKIFYIGEDIQGKKFYATALDITELQVINAEMPGAYFRSTADDGFEFLFISRNFLNMVGYTRQDLKYRFENRLINMIHPEDRNRVILQSGELAKGLRATLDPYRILHENGEYIYVAESCHITDRFGAPCWQTMAIDITEMMHLRNQMHLLSEFMTSSILFLHRTPEGLKYEIAVYGLADVLGMDRDTLEKSLNDGSFRDMLEGYPAHLPPSEFTEYFVSRLLEQARTFNVLLPDGKRIALRGRMDRISDPGSKEEFIFEVRPEP